MSECVLTKNKIDCLQLRYTCARSSLPIVGRGIREKRGQKGAWSRSMFTALDRLRYGLCCPLRFIVKWLIDSGGPCLRRIGDKRRSSAGHSGVQARDGIQRLWPLTTSGLSKFSYGGATSASRAFC